MNKKRSMTEEEEGDQEISLVSTSKKQKVAMSMAEVINYNLSVREDQLSLSDLV